jgi:hypothetical protein
MSDRSSIYLELGFRFLELPLNTNYRAMGNCLAASDRLEEIAADTTDICYPNWLDRTNLPTSF